jgi:peptidoglycan L-alanyl-D-glutamate endopeptidase CwlK
MGFKLSPNSLKRLLGVDPDLVKVVKRAAELSERPFEIVQGVRTQQEQDRLYAQGRTRSGPIVTWTRNSNHLPKNGFGQAIDFAVLVDGKISWDEKLYPWVARAFYDASRELGIGITSGQEWTKKDWGHIERNTVRDVHKQPTIPSSSPREAYKLLLELGWGPLQASALVANGMWESGGNRRGELITTALGDAGTAHGAWQWRQERYSGPKGLLRFSLGRNRSSADLETQVRFVHSELNDTERRAGNMLLEAKTLEEACKAAIAYLRPVGFTWEEPEKGHAFERRLELTNKIYEEMK